MSSVLSSVDYEVSDGSRVTKRQEGRERRKALRVIKAADSVRGVGFSYRGGAPKKFIIYRI